MKKSCFRIFFWFCILISADSLAQNEKLSFSDGLAVWKEKDIATGKFLYGFADENRKVVIPCKYDTVYRSFRNGFAITGINQQAGVINKKGKSVVPFSYKNIGQITRGIIPVQDDEGLWGFYRTDGKKFYNCQLNNYRFTDKGRIIAQKEGKWGVISSEGALVKEFSYNFIQYLEGKTYRAQRVNVWHLKDFSNNILQQFEFDSVFFAGENMFRFAMVGNYGIVNIKGQLLTSPVYHHIGNFRNGMVVVKKFSEAGVISKEGREIIPLKFSEIIIDSLYIRVRKDNLWGLYDLEGRELIKPSFSEMKECSNEMLAVRKENYLWGYAELSGHMATDFLFERAGKFSQGIAEVWMNGSPSVINKSGEHIITSEDYDFYKLGLIRLDAMQRLVYAVPQDKYDSYQRLNEDFILVTREEKKGVIDNNGKEILSLVYDEISAPSAELFFSVRKDGKSGVVEKNEKYVLPLSKKFEYIGTFYNGLAKMKVKGMYGFMDASGNIWIAPQYPEAGEYSDGLAAVKINGKWAFVDKDERLKVQPYYDKVQPFKNGKSVVRINGSWNIVNREGKELHEKPYEKITETISGRYLLIRDGKYGMADINGKEILSPKYEMIEDLGGGMVKVKKDGEWGILDYRENFLIPIENEILQINLDDKQVLTGKKGKAEVIIIK